MSSVCPRVRLCVPCVSRLPRCLFTGVVCPTLEGGGQIPRVVDGGVTATGVLSCERGNLITISSTLYASS